MMKIEADLSDGDDFWPCRENPETLAPVRGAGFVDVTGVDSRRGKDSGMGGCESEVGLHVVEITGNRDDPPHAGLAGAGENSGHIPGETIRGEVGMGVGQKKFRFFFHRVAFPL
jgi:hypothetical protein